LKMIEGKKARLSYNPSRRHPWTLQGEGELWPRVTFFDSLRRDLSLQDSPTTHTPYILLSEIKYKPCKIGVEIDLMVAFLDNVKIEDAFLEMIDSDGEVVMTATRKIDIHGAAEDTLKLNWKIDFER